MKVPERRLPFVHLALIGILVGAATLLPLFAQGPAPTGQYDAQAPASAARNKSQERERAKPPSHAVTNGIHVADAKLFDERTLQQMLQAAEANLASLRFLDQSTAGAAVGRMQGGRLDQWSIGMSATLPTSATSATNTTDHKSEAGADGTKTTDTVSTSQTTTSPAQTPTVPAPPALPSTFAAGNQIGVAAQDVLAEQVMLTYQVMNLRLLLDRAISDRVFARDATLGGEVVPFVGQRRQVVVGFQVNVEPDRRYKNAIAEVDVRVVDCREASQAMRELTSRSSPSTAEARQKMLADKGLAPCGDYVVAPAAAAPSSPPAAANKDGAAGRPPGTDATTSQDAAARAVVEANAKDRQAALGSRLSVVSLMPQEKTYNVATLSRSGVGFGFGALASVFNLGVAGSKSRETIYLVKDSDTVALLRRNEDDSTSFGWQFRPVLGRSIVEPGLRQVFAVLALPVDAASTFTGAIVVRTAWRKYDSKGGIVGDAIGEPNERIEPFVVGSVDEVEKQMAPQAPVVNLYAAGRDTMLVDVHHSANLYPDTKLIVGDVVALPSQGFDQKGESGLRFLVPTRALAAARGVYLSGRFGKVVPLERTLAGTFEVVDNKANVAVSGDSAAITVLVRDPEKRVPRDRILPVLIAGDAVLTCAKVPTSDGRTTTLTYQAPASALTGVQQVTLKELLGGQKYSVELQLERQKAFAITDTAVLSTAGDRVTLGVSGARFDCRALTVWINNRVIRHQDDSGILNCESEDFLTLRIAKADFAAAQSIIFVQRVDGEGARVVVPLLKHGGGATPTLPSPLASVPVGSVKTIRVKGKDLGSILVVRFGDQRLRFAVSPDGDWIDIELPAALTTASGEKELVFELPADVVRRTVIVQAATK